MYGKRRIVVSRDGRTSLQGSVSGRGGSYHPMGNIYKSNTGWEVTGLQDEGTYGQIYIGTFKTKQHAKNALYTHYKTTTRYID